MKLEDFTATSITGQQVSLSQFKGKLCLIVNVASKCGFTNQYSGLQALYAEFHDQGFTVLGFPCDQFGHQEPEDDAGIASFCETQFGITFPMFAKIEVNGTDAHPIYQWLKSSKPGLLGTEAIKWNFTKFLIGQDGHALKRYAPNDTPSSIREDIARALKASH
jgi:glutathione peroxidase